MLLTLTLTVTLTLNQELAVHANKVMSTVGFVIANLRNLETLVLILRDVHTRHIGVCSRSVHLRCYNAAASGAP